MPLAFATNSVRLEGHCAVEEALPLAEFLDADPDNTVALDDCLSMHTALLQALIAARPRIVSHPSVEPLAALTRRIFGADAASRRAFWHSAIARADAARRRRPSIWRPP